MTANEREYEFKLGIDVAMTTRGGQGSGGGNENGVQGWSTGGGGAATVSQPPLRPTKTPKVEWCQVIDKVYVRCFICGKHLKKGSHVLRIATSDSTFVYQEKRCLDELMQSAPFDMYDQIKADLEAGKGFNWNG